MVLLWQKRWPSLCLRAIMAFLDTPRTEVGNGTFHTNGHNIDDLSLEHSFHSPKKREHGLIAELRKQRGAPVRTPGVQAIPSKRPNPQNKRQSGEFTPLLKSTTKHHSLQECRASLLPNGSAIRKPGSRKENLPLQQTESSGLYDSDNSKSFLGARTPLQPIANGSTGSTPLAVPHERNAVGLRDDQPNQMSLREQENVSRTEVILSSVLALLISLAVDYQWNQEGKLRP